MNTTTAQATTVLTHLLLSHSTETAVIKAPADKIDIAGWLLNLPDAEYQRCAPPDHKAAGRTTSADGRPMSINVEMIGTGLVIQHYVAETAEKLHCHMNSLSDVYTPQGWTTVNVVWDLQAEAIDENTCRYTNSVTSYPTEAFMDFITAHGQSFEEASAVRQEASGDHNRRETPQFAASIERKALAQG
ncbi:hypothetical protein ACFQ46_22475 [Kineococcus sp. GCM10028916]|uniref:hypothetical protein n=1 Tax=Kineococcus sp. GCM10028916 TaxID=3273394 RepID=UPI00362704F1